MLIYNIRWRVTPPANGRYANSRIPDGAMDEFFQLISRSAPNIDREEVLWRIKHTFAYAAGKPVARSSSVSWAHVDARQFMEDLQSSPPQFLEAYHDVCAAFRAEHGESAAPGDDLINELCVQHGIGYRIAGQELLRREETGVELVIVTPSTTLLDSQVDFREFLHGS